MDFFKKFESVNALVTYLDNAEVQENFKYHRASESTDDPSHYGYGSYEEARKMLLEGDHELQKKLRGTNKLDINVPENTGIRKRMVTRVSGFAPHVPNFLAGVPNNMLWVEEQKISEPVITIIYNTGCLGGSSGSTVTMVSARIMSAIMSVERKGYRVNLYAASAQDEDDEHCGFIVKIKDSGQHIDTLKMALPMISPAMNRRFGFRFRETMPGLSSSWVGDYGHSMGTENFKKFLDRQGFRYDVALAFESVKHVKNQEQLENIFIESTKTIKQKH